jgi:tetratricopeptide (TPR) repeat protein
MFKLWVSMCRVLVGFGVCVAVVWGTRGVAQTWREVDSPHFRVVTDGSERDGRDVAKEFEQMRAVFAARFNNPSLETGAPLLIFAVRESGLKGLAPSLWKDRDHVAGEFFKGWEKQYAMVRLDSFGDLNQAVVFHEYTHSILHANVHWLPMWLDEGLAEFYAYTRFEGDKTYVGAPSVRYNHLKSEVPIPAAEMLTMTQGKLGRDDRRNDLFYGESWAMVHYMTFGPEMGVGGKLNAFMTSLEKGTPQAEAFEAAFGDPKTFDKKLATYLSKLTMSAAVLPRTEVLDAKSFPARVLTAAETSYAIGCFDIGVHDPLTAMKRLQAAEAANDALAGPHEELGFLAWREGRDEEAKAEWKKAVAADPGMYRSAFALLMSGKALKEQSDEELEATRKVLEEIETKAPKFAPVRVELALIEWRLGEMNKAYKDAVSAQGLEPWRAGYRLLAGYILLQGHQPQIAEGYARRVAERWEGSDHDEAVELWQKIPAKVRGDGPELTMAIAANATVVRGTIVNTWCDRNGVGVTIQPTAAGAQEVKAVASGLFESGFSDTLWEGEDHYTPCFHVAGLPGVVAYQAGADGTHRLVELEVRDDLPALNAAAMEPAGAGAKP